MRELKYEHKMTNEQAIKVLTMVEAYGLADEAKTIAMEALKKQIPKKVMREKRSKHGTIEPYCPNCDENIFDSADPFECYENNYCSKCGQRLDWSDAHV